MCIGDFGILRDWILPFVIVFIDAYSLERLDFVFKFLWHFFGRTTLFKSAHLFEQLRIFIYIIHMRIPQT